MAYITDYSERGDLATPPVTLWSRRLPGRIVTLELQGQQSKMAEKMESGGFFVVKHMRLIERIMGVGKVVGRIGGPDRLIHKLNANSPNEELERLLQYVRSSISDCLLTAPHFRRKKQWEEGNPTTAKRTEGFTTIAHVLKSRELVDKFRIRAHVVGTFPLRLEDCVVRRCKSCSEEVPTSTDACLACMASDGEAPEWESMFHLFLRLQDEHGHAQITVAVDQNSSILNGLTPDDVIGASGSAEMVRERLADYVGNIEAVQTANSQGRTLATKVLWYVQEEEEDGDGDRVIVYGLA
ncbi:hypothetical protein BJV78DRAFT_1241315 [Lactifluus subvellereus]|nr:hypothetical protein BJV78DRAFT_1241315 [Lactifluus subvellereus]